MLAVLLAGILLSCEQKEVIENQNVEETEGRSNIEGILSFKNYDEFSSTLSQVIRMTDEERIRWEKSQGFESFGTVCDNFYRNIDPSLFSSRYEVDNFIKTHSKYVQLYEDHTGMYFEIQEFNNPERFLMNSDKMFVIGNQVFKKINETYATTSIENLDKIKKISNISFIKSNSNIILENNFNVQKAPSAFVTSAEDWANAKIGNDTYRLRVWIETFYLSNWGPESRVTLTLRSYTRWLAIYWGLEAPVTATFKYTINNSMNETLTNTYTFSGWVQKQGYEYVAGVRQVSEGTSPFFTNFNCYAYNTIKTKKGTCSCIVELVN
ncbi:MAG: hypothetical protein ACK5KP_10370 [Paludibacteraceae bacterium]